jgi:hypothetical protein
MDKNGYSPIRKPEDELVDANQAVTYEQLHALAQDMHERLTEAANILKVLTKAGWGATMMMYDIWLSPADAESAAEVKAELAKLGIDPDKLRIEDFEDDCTACRA